MAGPSERKNDTREERNLFPVWTLIVIAGCAALWLFGAKIAEEQMAGYEAYTAIGQTVAGDTFYPGVRVDGVDLGGMTREEAAALFGARQKETSQAFSLVVASGDKKWRITSDEVPMTFNEQTVLEQAYNVGRYGTLEERYKAVTQAAEQGVDFETGFTYDRGAIDALVKIIAENLDRAPQNATLDAFNVEERTFTFKDAKPGYRIDQTRLQEDILAALDEGAYDRVIEPKGESVEPEVTRAQLEGHFGKMASFTTQTTKDRDRNNNIAISAEALNGRVVMPGDTFSFNNATGQRTGEKGYREAGAIAGGVLVDDTGGGVCQTSSTLFNAVVRADLEIVKRSAHSWPSSYVNKGEDATVNWPSLDFVFRNNSEYPIFLVAWYEEETVTVEVYGKLAEDYASVELASETVKTIKPDDDVLYTLDPSLPIGTRKAGRKKRTGYVVDTYKVYKDAQGNEIRREKLWTTTYRATQDEILYNDGSMNEDTMENATN